MRKVWNMGSAPYRRSYRKALLIMCWLAGSASGILFSHSASADAIPFITGAVCQPITLCGALVVGFVPFLISALAVFSCELWVLPLVGGMKGFGYCFVICAISMAFGDSGWLIRCMLLFSDTVLVPLLCLFDFRYFVGGTNRFPREWFIWFLVVAVVVSLDYFVVSPFFVGLF